jgi:hypothetical protein
MNLLLITLSIHVEEDQGRIIQIFWILSFQSLLFIVCGNEVVLNLIHGQHFLIIVRKEHAIQPCAVGCPHYESTTIMVILKHLFHLIM